MRINENLVHRAIPARYTGITNRARRFLESMLQQMLADSLILARISHVQLDDDHVNVCNLQVQRLQHLELSAFHIQ